MNDIEFLNAKNGSLSCLFNGKPLHSLYNPENEAKRFSENLNINFKAEYICIIEPALSYCAEYLKKLFPDAKITCIRLLKDFGNRDILFDRVFYFDSPETFENNIYSYFGEEGICKTFFINWEPAAKLMSEDNLKLWTSIKNVIVKASSSIYTHNCFAKRWIKNSVKLSLHTAKTCSISRINCPIVVAASGPSLKDCISTLRKTKDRFFLMAVSSSLNALLNNGLIPDLVISTDGGWWAKKHLEPLSDYPEIPVALSPESNCNPFILQQNPVFPLIYRDGFESELFSDVFSNCHSAERNGTVSGTAAELALSMTDMEVYAFGLDLCSGTGLQHTAPNLLEPYNSLTDNKTRTKETRICRSRYNTGALNIYSQWFSVQNSEKWKRFYRVSKNGIMNNSLGSIRDISVSDFCSKTENSGKKDFNLSFTEIRFQKDKINSFLKTNWDSEQWLKNAFPADWLKMEKNLSGEQHLSILNDISIQNENLKKQLEKILYG